jgi:hypothetical protein
MELLKPIEACLAQRTSLAFLSLQFLRKAEFNGKVSSCRKDNPLNFTKFLQGRV